MKKNTKPKRCSKKECSEKASCHDASNEGAYLCEQHISYWLIEYLIDCPHCELKIAV